MSLLLKLPVELASLILSEWVNITAVCRVDVAHCSPSSRGALMAVYDNTVVKCRLPEPKGKMFTQLRWMVMRNLRMSLLEVVFPEFTPKGFNFLKTLVRRAEGHLRHVEICGEFREFSALLVSLSETCPNIETLLLENCTISQTKPFGDLLRSSKHLTRLELAECTEVDATLLDNLLCPFLSKLVILCGRDVRGLARALVKASPNLQEIYQLTDEVDLSVFPATMEVLKFDKCEFVAFDAGISFPKARQLHIYECDLTDDNLARLTAMCPSLSALNLMFMIHLSFEGLAAVETFGPTLTHLTLNGCHGVSESALQTVLQRCKLLDTVNIVSSSFMGVTTVYHALLDSCPLVRRVNLDRNELSDDILRRLAAAPLTHVSIHEAYRFSDVGLAILVMCPTLQELVTDGNIINSETELLIKELRPDLFVTSKPNYLYE